MTVAKFVGATLICLGGCVWVPESRLVPHARLDLPVSPEGSADQTIESAEPVLLKIGFTKQINDWQVWQPILDEKELALKKRERRYLRDKVELAYSPERQGVSFASIHLYEQDADRFTDAGFRAYEEVRNALAVAGVQLLDPTPENTRQDRGPSTPDDFNALHPPPTFSDRVGHLIDLLAPLCAYAGLILVPVFWIGLLGVRRLELANAWKRAILVACSLLAAPVPMPMSIVGPFLFLPALLWVPFGIEALASFASWIAGSFMVTGFVGLIAASAFRLEAQQIVAADAPKPARR